MSLWNVQSRLLELAKLALPFAEVEHRTIGLANVAVGTDQAVYVDTWEETPETSEAGPTVQVFRGAVIVGVRSDDLGDAQAAATLVRDEWKTDPTLQGLVAVVETGMTLLTAATDGDWAVAVIDVTATASASTLPGVVTWELEAAVVLRDPVGQGDAGVYVAALASALEAALATWSPTAAENDIDDLAQAVAPGEIVYQLLPGASRADLGSNVEGELVAVRLRINHGLAAGTPERDYLRGAFLEQTIALLDRPLWLVGRPDASYADTDSEPELDFPGTITRSS